jgi:hypothetical protein
LFDWTLFYVLRMTEWRPSKFVREKRIASKFVGASLETFEESKSN